jgi:pyruvate dehydrogenase E1 component alpha subunit
MANRTPSALSTQPVSRDQWIEDLQRMIGIRQLELRAEAAYLQGHIGGFFHSYVGQEAVQTAALRILGPDNWWATSYRCHALAYLLGANAKEIMAEFFGRSSGNAKGRGGSMHLYTDRLMGGFGIVGGQVPIATGAAFALKYQGDKKRMAVCFLGDGAVAQGAFHESLNMAALWDLPCLYVIENNEWGMGTAVSRAISVESIAEAKGPSFGMPGKTVDGMDYFSLLEVFQEAKEYVLGQGKPYLLEVKTQRFKGHSISDPGLYRKKEELSECMKRDPIALMKTSLLERSLIKAEEIEKMEKLSKEEMLEAIQFASDSPWPDLAGLEEDVMAP